MMGASVSIRISSMRYPESSNSASLIEDFRCEILPNQFVSFLGRSGVGKTTLLRMIAGLEPRFEGQIAIDGKAVTEPSRSVQMVFQDYRLLPWKTVYENIEFAARRHDSGGDGEQVETWLKTIRLFDKKDAWPKTLSGGEAGRVAFARAFVSSPAILLLDEPFSNLDMIAKMDLQNELQEYLRIHQTTVVFVSHSIEDVVLLSDTIHLLSNDKMRVVETFELESPRPRRRADLLEHTVYHEILARLGVAHSRELP